jgi:hypothetical protein
MQLPLGDLKHPREPQKVMTVSVVVVNIDFYEMR